jgi:uncharacterized membrane protein
VDAIQFVNKWLHLLSIIGALGGIMFAWIVLRPGSGDAVAEESDEGAKLRWKRWGIAQAVLWVVVLVTGFANYVFVSPNVIGRYHMFAGMKMALALLMFVLVVVIGHPMPAMAKLVRSRAKWLTVLMVLGVIVVGISTYLNIGRVKRTLTRPVILSTEQPMPGAEIPGAPSP